ncbi:MAG: porin [Geminicoccaceae bacterium]
MNRHALMGSVGALALSLSTPEPLSAQQVPEVVPGGALDLTLTGFNRFWVTGGQLDDEQQDDSLSRGPDFTMDTEFHVVARGKSEEYGFEYGGTIEFEADTNQTLNTDETWLFLRGDFGEFRFGDDDSVIDDNKIGGFTVAAGTGGIDGDVVSDILTYPVQPYVSDDATKVTYYTPDFGGFLVAIGYTPNQAEVDGAAFNGNALARKNGPESVKVSDQVESALVYQGDVADIGVQASVYGAWARYNHNNDDDTYGDDSAFYSYGGGFALDLYGINVGAGGYHQKIGDFEQTAVNAGIGVGFGPVNTSLTWGQTVALSDSPGIGNPWLVVLSADIGLAPGLSLAGDISYFDNEVDQTGAEILGYSGGDKGWVGIARLGLDF